MKIYAMIPLLLWSAHAQTVEWPALSGYRGASVKARLVDRTAIHGKLERAADDGLTLEGRGAMIPRKDLESLDVLRHTSRGRVIGAVAGVVLGVATSAATFYAINGIGLGGHNNVAAPIAAGAGVGVGVFLIGWKLDRHWMQVAVRPAPLSAPGDLDFAR
jgi:outer membrane scaffolding protein for murein synthesis (MipA/OmpV family)